MHLASISHFGKISVMETGKMIRRRVWCISVH